MALTATATQGFELLRYTEKDEVLYVPGDPGDTFTRGNQCVASVGEGLLDPGAANEGGIIGRVQKTVTCPAATQGLPYPAGFDPVRNATKDQCLVAVQPALPAGIPIYLVTFANHWDDTVTSWTAGTQTLVVGTGMSSNDYPNGGLVYVYEGTGAGQVNVVADYVHSSTSVVMHYSFETALDTSSKVIVLGGEAATNKGVGFFGRCESAGATSLTVNQGADDGDWLVYLDFRDAGKYLSQLKLPVIEARYLALA